MSIFDRDEGIVLRAMMQNIDFCEKVPRTVHRLLPLVRYQQGHTPICPILDINGVPTNMDRELIIHPLENCASSAVGLIASIYFMDGSSYFTAKASELK
jgi:hypothetical protein